MVAKRKKKNTSVFQVHISSQLLSGTKYYKCFTFLDLQTKNNQMQELFDRKHDTVVYFSVLENISAIRNISILY